MLGGCACAGADCAGTVVAAPFGCPLVIGCVYIDPGDDIDDVLAAGCGCTVFAGCFCVVVCAALGAVAAGACFCAADGACCLYTAPAVEALLWVVPVCWFSEVCAIIIVGAAQTPAQRRPSIRIHPTRLIMESSGARRFQLHYDCVAIL